MDYSTEVKSIPEDILNGLFSDTPQDDKNDKIEDKPEKKVEPITPEDGDVKEIEDVDSLFDENEEKNKDVDDKTSDDKNKNKDNSLDENKKEVLKNTVNYLVEKGLWKDFDNRDEIEFTEDLYAELAEKQAQEKVDEMYKELLDSSGVYGKAIINHIKQGGNPDEIIDLFKEQKAIQNFDISNLENQKEIITKYYTEVVGWSKSKTDKFLSTLEADENGLEEESKDVQSKFDELFTKQVKAIEEETKQKELELQQERKRYIDTLSKTIDSYEEFTDSEKKLVKNAALNYNKTLSDGTKVSEFYLKFQEMQKDPKQYIKLIHFVIDQEGYNKKLTTTEKNKIVDKTWNFVKGNSSVTKSTDNQDTQKQSSKISFSFKKQ